MEKKLTMLANCAIVVVAIAICIFVYQSGVSSRRNVTSKVPDPASLLGKTFPYTKAVIPHRKNVIIALSVGCKFCSSSAPFYRSLYDFTSKHQAQMSAVLPQSNTESSSYVKGLGLDAPYFSEVDFAQVKVRATPTIFLIDEGGIVIKVWQGQLGKEGQSEVLASLT